jgi:predicted Zn-dependent peptidase
MRKTIFSLLTVISSYAASAQSVNIKFTEYDLPNGLHVILHEDHTIPTVAISVLYHVGSKNEDPTRTGFAHFFEHLLFEGSENIERGEYMKLVQNNFKLNTLSFFKTGLCQQTIMFDDIPEVDIYCG